MSVHTRTDSCLRVGDRHHPCPCSPKCVLTVAVRAWVSVFCPSLFERQCKVCLLSRPQCSGFARICLCASSGTIWLKRSTCLWAACLTTSPPFFQLHCPSQLGLGFSPQCVRSGCCRLPRRPLLLLVSATVLLTVCFGGCGYLLLHRVRGPHGCFPFLRGSVHGLFGWERTLFTVQQDLLAGKSCDFDVTTLDDQRSESESHSEKIGSVSWAPVHLA